jgi:integrase
MAALVVPFTRWRSGKLYLNLPIPADLRLRYLTASGKPRTHIVEALGTGDPTEGRKLARELQAFWELEFAKQRRGHAAELPSTIRKARELREAMAAVRAEDNEQGIEAIEHRAADLAEKVEEEAGEAAALQVYALATQPERLTLLEALGKMDESPDATEGTKVKRRQQVAELLKFLKVEDCLPDFVTEARAVAYVDWLNSQPLGYSTKQDRLSGLQSVWRFLARKRQVPASASPWRDHELTKRKPGAEAPEPGKRGWTTAEVLKLFQAPEGSSRSHYSRPLFLELYTLGFCTGMRLDEIVSLAPEALEEIPGGLLVKVMRSKTEAGVRSLPVVHPAAVSILKRRITLQTNPAESIFPECRPGGPDNRLSWHVQKAMGRDRDRLGFGSAVDFHSTRRCFMTIMERAGASVVHAQRYVGHRVPTLMHSVYSDGASLDNLRKVAELVKYPPEVEEEFAKVAVQC